MIVNILLLCGLLVWGLKHNNFNDHVVESYPDEKGMSHEDVIFMEKAKQGLSFSDGHYTVPLPFRDEHLRLPDNKSPVLKRTLWQKNKMLKDEKIPF